MNEIERPIVAKFGGSSMANSERIKQVGEIIKNDPKKKFIVVSAPGKIEPKDKKITDQLIECHTLAQQGVVFDSQFNEIQKRFREIGKELKCSNIITGKLKEVYDGINNNKGIEWTKSRGEYLSAIILAEHTKIPFIDATDLIIFNKNGQVNNNSYKLIKNNLPQQYKAVIPGFYGLAHDGEIKTFPRGGSDITGAIIAKGVNAKLYENWTDVNGLYATDPKIVNNPKTIEIVTYEEIRELGERGAEVLHKDTILPVLMTNIPINIKNTFNSNHPGTMIVKERTSPKDEQIIGIASKTGFVAFEIQKYGMNQAIGTGNAVLNIFKKENVSYEHDPTGHDYLCVIAHQSELEGNKINEIANSIITTIKPDKFNVEDNLGLLSIVGQKIKNDIFNTSGRLFAALYTNDIKGRLISYPPSGISMIIGVDNDKTKQAVKIAHDTLISQ